MVKNKARGKVKEKSSEVFALVVTFCLLVSHSDVLEAFTSRQPPTVLAGSSCPEVRTVALSIQLFLTVPMLGELIKVLVPRKSAQCLLSSSYVSFS